MENIDKQIAEILLDYNINENFIDTTNKLKELFSYEQLLPIDERVKIFSRSVFAWNYKNKERYDSAFIVLFIDHWTRLELNMKMQFENQPFFKIGGRLSTFAKTNPKFENKKRINKLKHLLGSVNPLR